MNPEDTHKYDDILHLPHPVSRRYPQMPLSNRAAQFSPFAALTGHEAAIRETARLTDSFVELGEDQKAQVDEQLRWIQENLAQKPACEITYFQPDGKKDGGSYITIRGRVKKIDAYTHQVIFTDGTVIPIASIFSIEL